MLPKHLLGSRVKRRTHPGACRGLLEGLEGAGKMGANMEQTFHNPNLRTVILQEESYLKKRKQTNKQKT